MTALTRPAQLMVVEGKQQYVWDETGRRYLDCFAGIVTVLLGHSHPRVHAAVSRQAGMLSHMTCLYAHPEVALYAQELAARLPDGLDTVFVVNSGSEATEMALALARAATGNYDVLGLRTGYHGLTAGAGSLTAMAAWKPALPAGFGYHHCLQPDPYRGMHGNNGAAYASDVADVIACSTSGRVAAFFAESMQGVGGVVPLASGYLQAVYPLVRAAGGLCVADEVQTGFGRCGSHYWGFQMHGVVPDIVTMAKGQGNGYPMGAVVTTAAIASALTAKHLNTFGGAPVASAAGRAVLRAIDEEGLQANAAAVGGHLMARLKALQARHDVLGDVRGAGLMVGVELVTDRASKAPAVDQTAAVLEGLRERGVLVGRGGKAGNVLRITPPLCINREDVDYLCTALDESLQAL